MPARTRGEVQPVILCPAQSGSTPLTRPASASRLKARRPPLLSSIGVRRDWRGGDGCSELSHGQLSFFEACDSYACSLTVGVVELGSEETPVVHECGYRA